MVFFYSSFMHSTHQQEMILPLCHDWAFLLCRSRSQKRNLASCGKREVVTERSEMYWDKRSLQQICVTCGSTHWGSNKCSLLFSKPFLWNLSSHMLPWFQASLFFIKFYWASFFQLSCWVHSMTALMISFWGHSKRICSIVSVLFLYICMLS